MEKPIQEIRQASVKLKNDFILNITNFSITVTILKSECIVCNILAIKLSLITRKLQFYTVFALISQ